MSLLSNTTTYTSNLGTVLANQRVYIFDRDRGYSAATVYSDANGAVVLAAPTTNGSGVLTFFAQGGNYSVDVGAYRFNVTIPRQIGAGVVQASKLSLTTRANTVTPVADPELVLPVEANCRYALDGMLFNGGPDTADFRLAWSGPAGYNIMWAPIGPAPGITADPATLILAQGGNATEAVVGIYTAGAGIVRPVGFVTTGVTAGNVSLMWAQGTTNAVPVSLAAGSWLRMTKL